MILEILELVCHNSEINWKTKEVKTTRCLNEYRKQWRPKKRKLELQKYKKKEKKERRRKETKKIKRGKNNKGKESGRRIGDLE